MITDWDTTRGEFYGEAVDMLSSRRERLGGQRLSSSIDQMHSRGFGLGRSLACMSVALSHACCETSVSLTGSDSSAVVLGFVSNARHGSSMVPLPLCLPRMHDGIPSPRLPRLGLTGGDRPNIHDTGP